MGLTRSVRGMLETALSSAPTVLEQCMWAWLLQLDGAREAYFGELMITDLEGDGSVPDEFPGEK